MNPPPRGRRAALAGVPVDRTGKSRVQARLTDEGFETLLTAASGYALSGFVRAALRVGLGLPLEGAPNREHGHGVYNEPVVQVVLAAAEHALLLSMFPNRLDRAAFVAACATDARIAATILNHISGVPAEPATATATATAA